MPNAIDPRILFAAERTLLAWNRTSLALIAFGFLVERSGLLLMLLVPDKTTSMSMQASLWTGLGFILLGVFSALFSTQQYAKVITALDPADFPKGYRVKWGMGINAAIAVLGLLLMASLYFYH